MTTLRCNNRLQKCAEEIQLHRFFADAQLLGAEAGDDGRKPFREVGVAAVGRFEIRLELLCDLGRALGEVRRADDDALRVFGNVALMAVQGFGLEERIVRGVRSRTSGTFAPTILCASVPLCLCVETSSPGYP